MALSKKCLIFTTIIVSAIFTKFQTFIEHIIKGTCSFYTIPESKEDQVVVGILHCRRKFPLSSESVSISGNLGRYHVRKPKGEAGALCQKMDDINNALSLIPRRCVDILNLKPVLAGELLDTSNSTDMVYGFNTSTGYIVINNGSTDVKHVTIHEAMHLVEYMFNDDARRRRWANIGRKSESKRSRECFQVTGHISSVSTNNCEEDMVETMAFMVSARQEILKCSKDDEVLREKYAIASEIISLWCDELVREQR